MTCHHLTDLPYRPVQIISQTLIPERSRDLEDVSTHSLKRSRLIKIYCFLRRSICRSGTRRSRSRSTLYRYGLHVDLPVDLARLRHERLIGGISPRSVILSPLHYQYFRCLPLMPLMCSFFVGYRRLEHIRSTAEPKRLVRSYSHRSDERVRGGEHRILKAYDPSGVRERFQTCPARA